MSTISNQAKPRVLVKDEAAHSDGQSRHSHFIITGTFRQEGAGFRTYSRLCYALTVRRVRGCGWSASRSGRLPRIVLVLNDIGW